MHPLILRYMGRLVTNQQNFCLPFGFVFIRMRSLKSWNFTILCFKKERLTMSEESFFFFFIFLKKVYLNRKIPPLRFLFYFAVKSWNWFILISSKSLLIIIIIWDNLFCSWSHSDNKNILFSISQLNYHLRMSICLS